MLRTYDPDGDRLPPDAIEALASACVEHGVAFQLDTAPEPLDCSDQYGGDCLEYQQKVWLDTPLVAVAHTVYFHRDQPDSVYRYSFVWFLGDWVRVGGGLAGMF